MEFSHNLDRDAYATIAGFVLQVDLTVLRWLNLDDSELLELECGRDALVRTGKTTSGKHHASVTGRARSTSKLCWTSS